VIFLAGPNIDRKSVQNCSKLTDSCDFCGVSEMRDRMEALGVPEAMFCVFDWSVFQILPKLRVKVVLAHTHKVYLFSDQPRGTSE